METITDGIWKHYGEKLGRKMLEAATLIGLRNKVSFPCWVGVETVEVNRFRTEKRTHVQCSFQVKNHAELVEACKEILFLYALQIPRNLRQMPYRWLGLIDQRQEMFVRAQPWNTITPIEQI